MKKLQRLLTAVCTFTLLFSTVSHAIEPGDADPGFGTAGIAIVDFTPVTGTPGYVYNSASAVDAQGRTWIAAVASGTNGTGLGLARLTQSGQLDGTFGTGGLVFSATAAASSVIGVRIDSSGRVYVAYSQGNNTSVTWHVCRVSTNGAFDTAFFGGCAAAAPATGAVAHDFQVNPANGNPWVLGTALNTGTNLYSPAVAIFDIGSTLVRTQVFTQSGANVDALAGRFNNFGALFFTGSYTSSSMGANADALLGFIANSGSDYSYQFSNIVGFDVGGSLNDVGRCVDVTPAGDVVIGVAVDGGFNGIYWGSAKFSINANLALDPNYGIGGKEQQLIGDPELGRSASNYSINDCRLSDDGALNMVGSYSFTDPVPNAQARAATLYRLLSTGAPDPNFGGAFATPGVFYTLTYPGAVLDYLRPATDPRPRNDALTTISTRIPHTGSIIVSGTSQRTDGSGVIDVAVMRVAEDELFNANQE